MLRSSTATGAFAPAAAGGLVWTLVRTDFKARYQPTVGGFLWALLKPLAMFAVLMAAFSFVFGSDPAYRFHLIIGLFLWDFFVEATKAGLVSLHAKGYLLNRARFPAWILVVTSVSNALITLAVFVVVITAFLTVGGRPPGPGARPPTVRNTVMTMTNTPSVISAFDTDVTTRIHAGNRALLIR